MEQLHLHQLFQVSEIEISYRSRVPYQDRIQIKSSATAYEILLATWDANRLELLEQFKILLLDQQRHCLGVCEIATGGTSACLIDPKIIFATALKARATGLILAHNHPSGNLAPSEADRQLTRRLMDGGKLLDIAILDHLIVTPRQYRSFVDEGLMP